VRKVPNQKNQTREIDATGFAVLPRLSGGGRFVFPDGVSHRQHLQSVEVAKFLGPGSCARVAAAVALRAAAD
jgi:hypothetical protein